MDRVPAAAAFLDDGVSQTLRTGGVIPTGYRDLREVLDGHDADVKWTLAEVLAAAFVEQLLNLALGRLRHGGHITISLLAQVSPVRIWPPPSSVSTRPVQRV